MNSPEEGTLLRVFIAEGDTYKGKPLYQAIVVKARELGIAGATVLRGMMGYGGKGQIHTTKVLMLSENLPVVVEIVDSEDKIELIKDFLDEAVDEGLITMEKVQVLKYQHS
jgi:PII-like signaling protein